MNKINTFMKNLNYKSSDKNKLSLLDSLSYSSKLDLAGDSA